MFTIDDEPFDPGALVAFRGSSAVDSPERALLRAVLVAAAEDVAGTARPTSGEQLDARAWILSSSDRFLSFVHLCHVFGLDPVATRAAILSRRRARSRRCDTHSVRYRGLIAA